MAGSVVRRRGSSPVWDPFEDLREWSRGLDRAFGQWPATRDGFWTPLADITETESGWTLELEVPGVDREDISVEVHGRQLTVSGERKESEREGVLRRRTRVTGEFQYAVTLGTDLDPEHVEAHLADGVLTVKVRKPPTEQPHRIEVR